MYAAQGKYRYAPQFGFMHEKGIKGAEGVH